MFRSSLLWQLDFCGGEHGVRRRRIPAMPMSFWAKIVVLAKPRAGEARRRTGKYVEHPSESEAKPKRRDPSPKYLRDRTLGCRFFQVGHEGL